MRNFILLFVIITILTSAVVGGAVYYWQLTNINNLISQNLEDKDQLNKQIQELQKQLADIQSNINNQPVSISEDWLTMTRNDLGISFKYPKDYVITDFTNEPIQSLKIASPDFSSELVGEPLKSIIKGYSFYIEAWALSDNLDLDKMIKNRLNPHQMAIPDQTQIPKEKIGNFEFALYTVNSYDEALFYNESNNRGWKVYFESENPQASHPMFLEFLSLISNAVESNITERIFADGQPYKFQLTIPNDWKEVIVTEEHKIGNLDKREIGYKFSLIAPKTNEKVDMFWVNIYKISVWQENKNQIPGNYLIYSDSNYTYTHSSRYDWDTNWGFSTTLTPYTSIIETFKKL